MLTEILKLQFSVLCNWKFAFEYRLLWLDGKIFYTDKVSIAGSDVILSTKVFCWLLKSVLKADLIKCFPTFLGLRHATEKKYYLRHQVANP